MNPISYLDTPWRIRNHVRRLLAMPLFRIQFALHGIKWKQGWRIFGMPMIQKHRGSQILLGNELELRSWRSSNPLVPLHPVALSTRSKDAVLLVGNKCGMTGTTIVCAEKITIGSSVFLGANTYVIDTDFHPLDPIMRLSDPLKGNTKPVVIEDNVFVGMNTMILKGVVVGEGSVIGAGSVVTREVPPRTIVAGNPARIIRRLHSDEQHV